MRDRFGRFVAGIPADNRRPVGAVRIRTRHKRGGERRAWIKTAEPNTWRLRAQVVWESVHGPIPRGMVIHHRDEDTLNDVIGNLELLTKAEHLARHRADYETARLAASTKARRALRWSTKSAAKRTGRPPKYDPKALMDALAAIAAGMSPNRASETFGVSRTTLYRHAPETR